MDEAGFYGIDFPGLIDPFICKERCEIIDRLIRSIAVDGAATGSLQVDHSGSTRPEVKL